MSSPRWHWSPYSGTQYLQQSETHSNPCHGLQARSLHFPQFSAGRPLHCRRSSCLRTIFENPIGSWNLPETQKVGLPISIKALFHFRLHHCKHFEGSPGLCILFSLKVAVFLLTHFRNITTYVAFYPSHCVAFVRLLVCLVSSCRSDCKWNIKTADVISTVKLTWQVSFVCA